MLATGLARAGVKISPAYVEVELDKGRPSGSFEITNTGKEPERYRANAIFFTLNEKGGLVRPTDSPFSIAPMVKFNPAEFEVPGNSTRQIRFIILTRGKLQPGEYWAGMEVESLQAQTVKGKDEGGREFNIKVVPSVLVPIFGKVGKVKYAGKMGEIQLAGSGETPELSIVAINEGEGRLVCNATYEVLDTAGKVVQEGQLGKSYVFRGSKTTLSNFIKPLSAGEYVVKIKTTSAQLSEPLLAETKVTWTAPAAAPVAARRRPTTRPAGTEAAKTAQKPSTQPAPVARAGGAAPAAGG
jgi:hypothetical protein